MPTGSQIALAVLAPVGQAASWAVVRWRGVSIRWAAGLTMPALGVVAAVIGPVTASRQVAASTALWGGLAAGVALYGGTVVFMASARRIPAIGRQTAMLYREASARFDRLAVGAVGLLSAAGEELVWRGVVLGVLTASMGSAGAASIVTWVGSVAVNAISARIPIVLGAVVGGAVWTGLAWWTGGVAAPVACHMVWTALMIGAPPPGARS